MSAEADRAIDALPPGARIVAGPGCGGPTTLLRALGERSGRLGRPHLYSGLLLEGTEFLDAVERGELDYTSWQPSGAVRRSVDAGRTRYLPARSSAVPALIERLGIDVALVRVGRPDRHGYVSLGPSVSYSGPAAWSVPIVIGEVDPTLPRTRGRSRVPVSRFAALVSTESSTPTYAAPPSDAVTVAIARHVSALIPPDPTLQFGIGAVPEALMALVGPEVGTVHFAGMATDTTVDMVERGLVDLARRVPDPAVEVVELMGTRTLMDFANDNPVVGLYPSTTGHDVRRLSRSPRFVSLNSALAVDLTGRVAQEIVDGRQMSGIGGSADFVEAARWSPGGLSVIALPATTRRGESRIVASLPASSPVTLTAVDAVVTEFGVADLRGLSAPERAEAIADVANPRHRDALRAGSRADDRFGIRNEERDSQQFGFERVDAGHTTV